MGRKEVFLIQSSGKVAQHETITFSDRTYADEAIKHGYYRNESWDVKKRDRDFGKVNIGNYIIQYCTNDVESNPGQIKYIYEVVGLEKIETDIDEALRRNTISQEDADRLRKENHIIKLKIHTILKKGLELSLIRKWVEKKQLSPTMNNCGRLGFNICEVDREDYQTIIEWNKDQVPEPPSALGALLEEDLRRYIVELPSLQLIWGSKWKDYKLFTGADGQVTGELFDTRTVGQIDLLYQNSLGDLLVVELKRTEDTSDKVVGQIARYLGWVQEKIGKGKKVEGILVARSASEELKYAVKSLKACSLYIYEIQFRFHHTS